MPGPVGGDQRADGAGSQHLPDAHGPQGPEVGPVVDPVRGEPVVAPVTGDEGDAAALEVADHDVVAGVAERGGHPHALGVVEELIEAGPADDADVGA